MYIQISQPVGLLAVINPCANSASSVRQEGCPKMYKKLVLGKGKEATVVPHEGRSVGRLLISLRP